VIDQSTDVLVPWPNTIIMAQVNRQNHMVTSEVNDYGSITK